MKIDDISGKQRLDLSQEPVRQGRMEPKDGFGTILENEMRSESSITEAMGGPARALETPERPVFLTDALGLTLSPIGVGSVDQIKEAEDTLSRLEVSLAAASGDPKRLESILQCLPAQAESLKSRTGDLANSHPLKSVADEFEILAYVESVKWSRGDYL